jgi:hypothetical protein
MPIALGYLGISEMEETEDSFIPDVGYVKMNENVTANDTELVPPSETENKTGENLSSFFLEIFT